MAAAIESLPFFKARAMQIGIIEADIESLRARNLATYGAFAFLAPYNSSQQDSGQLRDALSQVLPAPPDIATMPLWRRLQFDAHTHVLSDARARIERTESTEPRKVPMPEKTARLEDQKKRLSHLIISPELEPSHSLIDDIAQMIEDGIVRHIPIDKCTSRRQEISHIKKEPSVKIDNSGSMRLVQKTIQASADTSNSLSIRIAFQRRSLAFDQCKLVSYIEHERWVNHLFAQLQHTPPPGYAAVTMEQILNADVELWQLVADECRSGLSITAGGVSPVEVAIFKNMYAPQITYAILPLPIGKPGAKGNQKRNRDTNQDDDKPPAKKAKGSGKQNQGAKQGGKGSGKGQDKSSSKTKAATAFAQFPELQGMWSSVRGNPVCAKYQLGQCPEETTVSPGGWCAVGWHVCCVPKCFEKHSKKDHT